MVDCDTNALRVEVPGVGSVAYVSVPDFARRHGVDPESLPRCIRIMLEGSLRAAGLGLVNANASLTVMHRDGAMAFPIGRVLLQDAAGLPLLADLAALRDAVAYAGGDPLTIQPKIPVALVIDHTVQTDHYGTHDALSGNMALEFARNAERYAFVRWAEQAFAGLLVVPPGNGIVHQVHLERLAEVVSVRDGWIFCDTVIGTDSHTTMVNGLGVLGWGVGGIEAESALLGDLQDLAAPEVVGVELIGIPSAGTQAADLALTLTQWLRAENVVGAFLEFHGNGLDHLSVADRCTIANMAPEYGATLALFPTDQKVLDYLLATGRTAASVEIVRAHLMRQGLFGGGQPERIHYDRRLRFDLASVEPCVAGPSRPEQRVTLASLPQTLERTGRELDFRVVLAAITSCTNTANPEAMVTAGLLARKARARGLSVDPCVKTVLAPGSRAVTDYLYSLGLLKALEELGFHVAAYGCAVCVGNSGPLLSEVETALATRGGNAVAVLSGNRNFEARVHPALRSAYLMSPALVVAFALAGRVDIDLTCNPIARTRDGELVFLSDIWPDPDEVTAALGAITVGSNEWVRPPDWERLPAPVGNRFAWEAASTYFIRPPFFDAPSRSTIADIEKARPLVVLGDSVTTDHISPVGPIPAQSTAATYLTRLGVPLKQINTYAARRGNHHVMMHGTFANLRLKNLLLEGREGPFTRHMPSGEVASIFDVAARYRDEFVPLVVVAGQRYGTGSARDWAAKGTALLGVRALIAGSFERIHRSNLVRLGVLPVELSMSEDAEDLIKRLRQADNAYIDISLDSGARNPRPPCQVRVTANGDSAIYEASIRVDTERELSLLEDGDLYRHALKKSNLQTR